MKTDAIRSAPPLDVISSENELKKTSLTYKIARIAKIFFQCLLSPLFLCRSLRERFVGPTEEQIKDWQEKLNQNGLALKHAPDWVKKNEALVKTAISNNPDAVKHCSRLMLKIIAEEVVSGWNEELARQGKLIPYELMKNDWGSNAFKREFEKNRNFINLLNHRSRIEKIFYDFGCIISDPSHLGSIPLNLKKIPQFWLNLFMSTPYSDCPEYETLWERSLKDEFFCKNVYTQQGFWQNILGFWIKRVEFARSQRGNRPDFLQTSIELYSVVLKNLSNKIPNYLDLLQMALDYDGESFQYLCEDLRKDPEAILLAFNKSITNLQYVPLGKQERDFVIALLEKTPSRFDSIPDRLKIELNLENRPDVSQSKRDGSQAK